MIVGFAVYYLRVYKKGASVGGGLGVGLAAIQREKWNDILAPGEEPKVWGSGVRRRP